MNKTKLLLLISLMLASMITLYDPSNYLAGLSLILVASAGYWLNSVLSEGRRRYVSDLQEEINESFKLKTNYSDLDCFDNLPRMKRGSNNGQ